MVHTIEATEDDTTESAETLKISNAAAKSKNKN